MKKLFTLLFAVIANFSLSFAEIYSGTCGENLTWSLNTEDGVLTITGEGPMADYSTSEYQEPYRCPWYAYSSDLKTVVLPEGLTSIGDYAFYQCASLKTITIPDNVTHVGKQAFWGCTSLPERSNARYADTYLVEAVHPISKGYLTYCYIQDGTKWIGDMAFSGCYKISSLTLPSTILEIGEQAFNSCGITSITIPEGVTNIKYQTFFLCSQLKTVSLPNSVTSLGEFAFNGCTRLTTINIPDGITVLPRSVFGSCSSLQSIDLPVNLDSISYSAFSGCSIMEEITIPENVRVINYNVFRNCSFLTTVHWNARNCKANVPYTELNNYDVFSNAAPQIMSFIIGPEVEHLPVKICRNMSSLTSIAFPASMKTVDAEAFIGCTNLEAVHISDLSAWSAISFKNETANPLYYAKKLYLNDNLISDLVIPDNVSTIGSYAFCNDTTLTSVVIPSSVQKIGINAFKGCTSLPIVDNLLYAGNYLVEALDKTQTRYTIKPDTRWIGSYAFEKCTVLDTIIIPNGVEVIGHYAFADCYALNDITIPKSVRAMETSAFINTRYIQGIHISDIASWCAIDFDNAEANPIYKTSSLILGEEVITSITIPDEIKEIKNFTFHQYNKLRTVVMPEGITSIGDSAFFDSAIKTINIPNSVTHIGKRAFARCRALPAVDKLRYADTYLACTIDLEIYPKSFTIQPETKWIGDDVFSYQIFDSICIPDHVISIGENAFRYCRMREIILPATTEEIDNYAFYGCDSLKKVVCKAMTPPVCGKNVFCLYSKEGPVMTKSALYVPEGTEEAYMAADTWKDFFEIYTFVPESEEGIDQVINHQSPITNKVIHDGQLLILRGDKVFTVTGQEVR